MLYVLILVLLVLLSLIFSKSISLVIIDIIALAWLCISTPFLMDNAGYMQNYRLVITNANLAQEVTSKGWVFLSKLGLKFNLDYLQFKTIVFIFCMILLLITTYRLVGTNYSFVFGIYIIYPALVDIVQIRFFLSLCIVILGLSFFINDVKTGSVVYVICLILATSIHNTSLIYSIFLILPLMKKYSKQIVKIIIVVDIILIVMKNQVLAVVGNLATDKQQQYFDGQLSLFKVAFFILIMIFVALIIYYLKEKNENEVSVKDKNIINAINNINIIILLLVPLVPIAYNFYRLERISWFMIYMLLAILLKYKVKIRIFKYNISIYMLSISLALAGFIILMLHYEPMIIETYPFFNK